MAHRRASAEITGPSAEDLIDIALAELPEDEGLEGRTNPER